MLFKWLSKFAQPLAGVVVAVIVALSAALWWTTNRLGEARDRLAQARADTMTCVAANFAQSQTIRELEDAQDHNRRERDNAIRRQQEAIERVELLERESRQAETIERVVRVADGDACAHLPLPDRLRDAARSH